MDILTMPFSFRPGLALAASLLLSSTAALAQADPQADPGAPAPPTDQRQDWKANREARMHNMIEQRAHQLHDVLNLRPDQDAALQSLMASLAPTGHDGKQEDHKPGETVQLTTPQRLDMMSRRMAEHQAAFERRSAAIKQFYAVLSPGQRRAFDALPGLAGGDHHMGRGGPGDFGGGMGPRGMGPHDAGSGPMGHDGPEGPG
jgi:hypothetical protein